MQRFVIFYFLFQNNMREIIIIVANSKLFPFRHAVYFFPKCLILHIVKINAANLIGPIRLCVRDLFSSPDENGFEAADTASK